MPDGRPSEPISPDSAAQFLQQLTFPQCAIDDWRIENLRVSGILVTRMDKRVRGRRSHQSIYSYDPIAAASEAYAGFGDLRHAWRRR